MVWKNAPRLGLEPRTLKLTASCSAIELSGIVHLLKTDAILSTNQLKYQLEKPEKFIFAQSPLPLPCDHWYLAKPTPHQLDSEGW